jgi:hypothetical protein
VRPYIRATCNPDADSWVADFLAWWIDPETGLPIPERAGVVRYYIRVADKIEWADWPEDLMQHLPRLEDLPPGFELPRPISVTFIPATAGQSRRCRKTPAQYRCPRPLRNSEGDAGRSDCASEEISACGHFPLLLSRLEIPGLCQTNDKEHALRV